MMGGDNVDHDNDDEDGWIHVVAGMRCIGSGRCDCNECILYHSEEKLC